MNQIDGELTAERYTNKATISPSFISHVFHIRLHFLTVINTATILSRWSSAVLNPPHILFRFTYLLVIHQISLLIHSSHADVCEETVLCEMWNVRHQ